MKLWVINVPLTYTSTTILCIGTDDITVLRGIQHTQAYIRQHTDAIGKQLWGWVMND